MSPAQAPARPRRGRTKKNADPTPGQKRAREDIAEQRVHDRRRRVQWSCLERRQTAVQQARAAVDAEEEGSKWALRQALIDLSSAAEQLAAEMDPPRRRD